MLQIRAVTLSSYTDVARFLGIDGRSLLRDYGIPLVSLGEPEARISARAAAQLLEASAEKSGVDSFGIRMAECRSFASIGPVALLLQHLPNLGAAIECLAHLQRRFSDIVQVSCEQTGDAAMLRFDVAPEIKGAQAADLQIALGYLVLIGVSQGQWRPEAVHFTRGVPSDVDHFSRFFNSPLEFNSSFNGFSCSSASLKTALPRAEPTMAAHARRLIEVPERGARIESFLDHVRQSVALLLPAGRATLGEVAANLSLTKRSLQRKLAGEDSAFANVLNEARRNLAIRYLSASAKSISEIAGDLGYSNPSSFSRWFAGEFGLSAGDWRKGRATSEPPPATWKVSK